MRRGSHGEIYSLPDKNLQEISVNAGKDRIEIEAESKRKSARCPSINHS
jgi:hypothetical protein